MQLQYEIMVCTKLGSFWWHCVTFIILHLIQILWLWHDWMYIQWCYNTIFSKILFLALILQIIFNVIFSTLILYNWYFMSHKIKMRCTHIQNFTRVTFLSNEFKKHLWNHLQWYRSFSTFMPNIGDLTHDPRDTRSKIFTCFFGRLQSYRY